MFSLCPRCDNGKLDKTGKCLQCGYTLREKCDVCGHYNIPVARFCGGCGRAMSLKLRLQQAINQNISFLQKTRIRKFAAGATFGAMLAFFAFGSMGMRADVDLAPANLATTLQQKPATNFRQPFSPAFNLELSEMRQNLDPHRQAGLTDLTSVIDLLIKHLRPLAQKAGAKRLPAESAGAYTRTLHNFARDKSMTRGGTTLILFHFLSDLLDIKYRDFSQESTYSDIPRFHFLTVPANALSALGVDIARDEKVFGINDNMTVGQLFDFALNVMALAEDNLSTNQIK